MISFFSQLIQDEIKALVQLQNRQASIHSHTELSPTPVTKSTTNMKDYIFPLLSSDCIDSKHVTSDSDNLAAPVHTLPSAPSPPIQRLETTNQVEERATTVLSSGYGTLSAWDTGLEAAESPGEDEDGSQGKEKHHWLSTFQKHPETSGTGSKQDLCNEKAQRVEEPSVLVYQQSTSGYVWVVFKIHQQHNSL